MNLPSNLKSDPRFHQPVLPDVTECYRSAPDPQNKGLTSDSEADVTSMFPHLCSLSPKQNQALIMRVQGYPIGRIAKKLGVTRQTIYRWCHHHPAFVAELNKRQSDMIAQSNIAFRRLLRKSFSVLGDVLDRHGPDAVRVALAMVHGPAARKLIASEVGPTDEIGVVNEMALAEQRTWEPKDGYMEHCVHQEYVQRLAQLDFQPQPATEPQPTKEAD